MRDYYKGTPYDLTKGLLAGPWGTPNRFFLNHEPLDTDFERSISIYRTVFSYVAQARGWLLDACGGTLWFGGHAAHGTLYSPVAVGIPDLPRELSGFSLERLDRRGAFWGYLAVQALAEARFAWIAAEVEAMQAVLEADLPAVQAAADTAFLASGAKNLEALSGPYFASVQYTTRRWWDLFDQLVMRYADGFLRGPSVGQPASIGYPKEWLQAVGYRGPYPEQGNSSLKPPATPLYVCCIDPNRDIIVL